MIPTLGPDNDLIMIAPNAPARAPYQPITPHPPWLHDLEALAAATAAPPNAGTTPLPTQAAGMTETAARTLAQALLLPEGAVTRIWINPQAARKGESAARYKACATATTVGEYVVLHKAYDPGPDIGKPSVRSDLCWSLVRGDIALAADTAPGPPTGIVRLARASVAQDPATALLAAQMDQALQHSAASTTSNPSSCTRPGQRTTPGRPDHGPPTTTGITRRPTPTASAFCAHRWPTTPTSSARTTRTTHQSTRTRPHGLWTPSRQCTPQSTRRGWFRRNPCGLP